jgi:hypothetical protein
MNDRHNPAATALLAEQAGAYEMDTALKAICATTTQAERARILSGQLVALVTDGNTYAAAGATTMLLPLLERGLGIEPTRASTTAIQAALVAIVAEVIEYPRQRPYSSDSHLPHHLVERASTALVAAGFDVASLQTIGDAA